MRLGSRSRLATRASPASRRLKTGLGMRLCKAGWPAARPHRHRAVVRPGVVPRLARHYHVVASAGLCCTAGPGSSSAPRTSGDDRYRHHPDSQQAKKQRLQPRSHTSLAHRNRTSRQTKCGDFGWPAQWRLATSADVLSWRPRAGGLRIPAWRNPPLVLSRHSLALILHAA